jgi:hypothetical protein
MAEQEMEASIAGARPPRHLTGREIAGARVTVRANALDDDDRETLLAMLGLDE